MAAVVEKSSGTARRLAPEEPAPVVWEALRRRLREVVQECNWEAGEAILCFSEESGEPHRLKITDRADDASSVEILLDEPAQALSCKFSRPGRNDTWVFHVLADGVSLRRAKKAYTIHDAVDAILDHVVCP